MDIAWIIGLAFAVLVLFVNGSVYIWRARRLRALPACDAVEGLGTFHAVSAFAKECIALVAVVCSIPLGWWLPRCQSGPGERGPIILIHSWGLNSGSLWYLRHRLRRAGWSPVCCFEPGRGGRAWGIDVEGSAEALRRMIQQIGTSQPLTLIGHGVGGLVLRYCLRRYPIPTVRRIVTLGTPHRGTALARRGPLRDILAPGAPLLNKLNAVDHLPQQFDVIAIHSTFDALVVPPANATYPGAFNIQVNDVGHHALLFSSRVYELLVENLAEPLK